MHGSTENPHHAPQAWQKVQIPVPKTSSAMASLPEVSRVPLSALQKKIKVKQNMLDLFGEDDSETA